MLVVEFIGMLSKWGFDKHKILYEIHSSRYPQAILSLPVKISGKLRVTAGRATIKRSTGEPIKIELSQRLFSNGKEEVFDTFTHELAHLTTGVLSHDAIWRASHIAMGGNGKAYHNYANMRHKPRKPKAVAYCEHCSTYLYAKNRLRAGTYKHTVCGREIKKL